MGKSSIIMRFVHDQFNKNHLSTVQASFMNKKINFDNNRVSLNIWVSKYFVKFFCKMHKHVDFNFFFSRTLQVKTP